MSTPIDVYLLAGQSNMSGSGRADEVPAALVAAHPGVRMYFAPLDPPGPDAERAGREGVRQWRDLAPGAGQPAGGFGLELSFGHAIAEASDGRAVAIIKSDRGGTGLLRDWRPGAVDDDEALTNRMLHDAAQAIEQLLEDGHDPRLVGLVWYQGEADATLEPEAADGYGPALEILLRRVAEELTDGQDFDKVLFRVHPHNDTPRPGYERVRDQLVALAEADHRAAWINVDDLHYPDRLHLDGASLVTAGQRAAAALMSPGRHDAQPQPANDDPAAPVPPDAPPPSIDAPAAADDAASPVKPENQAAAHLAQQQASQVARPAATTPDPAEEPLPRPSSPTILALMNQKGGVGKTTTAVNVGAALANLGFNVLCIDLDPQAHLTLSLGVELGDEDKSNYDLLTDPDTTAMEVVRYTARDDKRLAVLPAETNLAGVESELTDQIATGLAQTILRNKCRDLIKEFDFVLIDCPPSLGLLTINALTIAQQIVVPMQAHFLALQGMTKLFETIGMVRQGINPDLTVAGVVLCMHEGNTILASEVIAELNGFFENARGTSQPWAGGQVFSPPIRRNIKLAEAPSFGQSVHAYAPDSNGAKDYLRLARSIAHAAVAGSE